jgi:hypothetical protein
MMAALAKVVANLAAQQRRRTLSGRGRFHRPGPCVDRARGHLAAQEPGGPAPVFRGLSLQETADVLGISLATVEREWQARLTGRLK